MIRSCLICVHMDHDYSAGGGGCDTCGYGGEGECKFTCKKGIWSRDLMSYGVQEDFNADISRAETCEHYKGAAK